MTCLKEEQACVYVLEPETPSGSLGRPFSSWSPSMVKNSMLDCMFSRYIYPANGS